MFARYFGWNIEYILSLSPQQISALQTGLINILNPEENKEYELKKQAELEKIKLESLRKIREKKMKKGVPIKPIKVI